MPVLPSYRNQSVNWFALQISWLVTISGQHWHLMGQSTKSIARFLLTVVNPKTFRTFCSQSKDPIPDDLKYFLLYKFTCASFSSSCTGETCHFKTRIEEHIRKDNKSHVFKHLHSYTAFFWPHNCLTFKTTDKANTKFDLKIKEVLRINRKKPNLNL